MWSGRHGGDGRGDRRQPAYRGGIDDFSHRHHGNDFRSYDDPRYQSNRYWIADRKEEDLEGWQTVTRRRRDLGEGSSGLLGSCKFGRSLLKIEEDWRRTSTHITVMKGEKRSFIQIPNEIGQVFLKQMEVVMDREKEETRMREVWWKGDLFCLATYRNMNQECKITHFREDRILARLYISDAEGIVSPWKLVLDTLRKKFCSANNLPMIPAATEARPKGKSWAEIVGCGFVETDEDTLSLVRIDRGRIAVVSNDANAAKRWMLIQINGEKVPIFCRPEPLHLPFKIDEVREEDDDEFGHDADPGQTSRGLLTQPEFSSPSLSDWVCPTFIFSQPT